MINKIKAFAKKYDMLPSGTILAAVSGGADSMCLLAALAELSKEMSFKVEAVHYNHMLRGSESDRDEAFVREQCAVLGIPCHVGAEDVASWANNNGCGLEEAGRKLRYSFFEKTADRIGACRIATAHNADDNCETVIMNMTRGAGLRGLCGIPPKRANVVRPLLILTRAQIEAFLTERHIPHIEDSSNASDAYTRNKLRHHVIPVLKEINPAFAEAVADMTGLLTRDRDYLETQASAFPVAADGTASVQALAALPEAVAVRVIRSLALSSLSAEQTDRVLRLIKADAPSGTVSLSGCTAVREYDALRFTVDCEKSNGFKAFELYDGFDEYIPELGVRFRCNKEICPKIIHKSFNSLLFKTEGLCGTIAVRPRLSGDRLTIAGRGVTKTLKKLMIENRVPMSRRELIPVFCDNNGVIGVMNMGQAPRTMPEAGDEVMKISVCKAPA